MKPFSITAAMLLLVSFAQGGLAQTPGAIPAETRHPTYADADRVPTEVLNPEARQVIVLPSEPPDAGDDLISRSGGAIAKVVPDAHRLPEGYVVANREARIAQRGRWLEADLQKVEGLPDAPPLRILPNGRLSMLESVLAGEGSRLFMISGRVTEFRGVNYILLESLLEGAAAPTPRQPAAPRPPAEPETAATAPAHEPTAEEVLRKMMEQRPRRALVLPGTATQPAAAPPAAADGREATRWPEGTLLNDRLGRVIQGDGWWTLAFEDPTKGPKDKPVRLLPSQLLETAIALSGGGSRPVVLTVSGEITAHKGINYLLIRKVLVRRNMGNFR